MTHHTDAERAHALAEKHGATSYRNRADTSNPAFGFTLGQLEALISEVEQAARRAPSMTDQSIIEAVDGWFARNTALGGCSDKDVAELAAIFAAAPQPPEAAPVVLPEPDAWRYTDARGHYRYRGRRHGFAAEYPLLKPVALYTGQQVRELLAAHGIGKDKA
ncbi:hypothetical protein N5J07_02585 [Comamonas aquatica]|uniref:hypothetical protein n=1 Tax=Comamonas aquatica TaxID=225991 RepID=UPI0024470818|nr:hypothetical protein [Comamonas aquatica]MDH1378360.1 hypothetical protein [Comamonas aquatica]MDH1638368.1 hypothetical protein [Comamonas aquatica]